jgi:glycosyltransferase involved in cell wall biosynthesis
MPHASWPSSGWLTTAPQRSLHIVNPLWDVNGGSDWRSIEMYRALSARLRVQLWSEYVPARAFRERYPVRLIRPLLGQMPIGGTFVFVGAYFRVGHWFRIAMPQRIVLIYNTHQPDRLRKNLLRLSAWHRAPVEVVYTSPALRRLSVGPAGPVIESPIDIARFLPASDAAGGARPFTVGRLSRDIDTKHHDEDPQVYGALANAGVRLRIMGGTCLQGRVPEAVAPALLPAGSEAPVTFLQGLDCFYYRTSDRWLEAYGRVVFEAMACGIPVVCGRRGGYADYIVDGINGFLFDTTEQALRIILRLRGDPGLRRRIGEAARKSVEQLYRGDSCRRKWQFFVSGDSLAALAANDPHRREPSDHANRVKSPLRSTAQDANAECAQEAADLEAAD